MDGNEVNGDIVHAKFTLSKLCVGDKILWMADEEVDNVEIMTVIMMIVGLFNA